MDRDEPLYVTRPWLPPLTEILPALQEMWHSRVLTNYGPFHRRFEAALSSYLGVAHVALVANATLGLMVALRGLGLRGEVVTTPFTFMATAMALTWSGLRPVFADVQPDTLNLDPASAERAITPQTTAILPVHCYGRPCDVDGIGTVAQRHGLKVVYDAAHAFGVRHRGESLLCHGDLSVVSFHATKVFNTFEGGMIVARDAGQRLHLERLADFGIVDEHATIDEAGINAKMNEFSAAIGLAQLQTIDEAIARRRHVDAAYRERLDGVPGIRIVGDANAEGHNHAYFPILVEPGYPMSRDALSAWLRERRIHARSYFHPLVSSLPMYRDLPSADPARLPVATAVARRILCLPMHPEMTDGQVQRVTDAVRSGAGLH